MPAKTKKELRQERLLQIIESGGFSTVEALVAQLDVTNQTVRRDTAELLEQGRVRRYHGGVAPGVRTDDFAYRQRRGYNRQAKERIAQAVAAAIPDNASVFLEVGGTTEAIAHALCRHNGLHIVTHSLRTAAILRSAQISASPCLRVMSATAMGQFSAMTLPHSSRASVMMSPCFRQAASQATA